MKGTIFQKYLQQKLHFLIQTWQNISILRYNYTLVYLISVLYKIAAAAIADMVKPYLTRLISDTQTGFVSGRYIGESTRLVYDIIDFEERHDVSGQLMLIDIEKAFDSISCKLHLQIFPWIQKKI